MMQNDLCKDILFLNKILCKQQRYTTNENEDMKCQ